MKELFTLGKIYPSDFLKPDEQPRCEPVELKLVMDENGLVRLEKYAPTEFMYGRYFYRSGINLTMRMALKNIVESILPLIDFKDDDLWCDVAANDGTLLSFVPNKFKRVGIDPAEDSFKQEALKYCDYHIQDFFSAEVYKKKLGDKKAKVITSIAMFYDVPDPKQFIKDVYDILEDDGLWVMQLSYSPLMIEQMAFDNICHEHIYYYNLFDLRKLLTREGFKIHDIELNNVNGGSIRLYIKKTERENIIGTFRIESLIEYERDQAYDFEGTWINWFRQIEKLKNQTTSFIKEEKAKGKSIWAYGASTKGNTLLQYFGLDNTLIDAIAERNPDKYGLRTIGSNIPIKSEEEMRQAQPDYLLVLPWHFKQEFIKREKEYLQKGGKMIFPCPTFEIISNESK